MLTNKKYFSVLKNKGGQRDKKDCGMQVQTHIFVLFWVTSLSPQQM